MALGDPLSVRFVSTDALVWEGSATSVLVRTTEGDLGILSGHEPFMAILVPHAAEVVGTDGYRTVIAVDSGFVSVVDNMVSVLSAYGELADNISLEDAEIERAALHDRIQSAEATEKEQRTYNRLESQIRAARKYQQLD